MPLIMHIIQVNGRTARDMEKVNNSGMMVQYLKVILKKIWLQGEVG